jgi:hypothetical protein
VIDANRASAVPDSALLQASLLDCANGNPDHSIGGRLARRSSVRPAAGPGPVTRQPI